MMTKDEFLGGGFSRYRDQAYWLWDVLGQEDWIFDAIREAYAQQATTASSVRWELLTERLLTKLQEEDPELAQIPADTFRQMVPIVAGGWAMKRETA
jgi:hypothetical protein